jgi:hypothetical protein
MRPMKSLTYPSLIMALVLTGCSGSNEDPQTKIAQLTDRLCKTMSIIGYNFSESAIQSLDESVQNQLLSDIEELKELAPSVLDRPLTELCQ